MRSASEVICSCASPSGPNTNDLATHAQKVADEAVAKLHTTNITASSRIATGEPEEALNKLVSEEASDLLVMGAYGHSRIRSLIIGSTTTAMIQSVKILVLLYR